MLETINGKIISVVSSHLSDPILSLTEIATSIRTELGSYINSIDVVSLNGDNYIQTLMNIDIDKAPKLGMQLTVGRDGRFIYQPKIAINFKALDK